MNQNSQPRNNAQIANDVYEKWSLAQATLDEAIGFAKQLEAPKLFYLLAADMERRWKSGDRVSVSRYLDDYSALKNDPVHAGMLATVECDLRFESNQSPVPEAYYDQFPDAKDELRRIQLDWNKKQTPQILPPIDPTRGNRNPHSNTRQVAGYEILEVLGRGGMGVVYKARDLNLHRIVALKVILGREHASPEQRIRFRIEAENVAALSHPNIVEIHELGEHNSQPYFTLSFVEGGTLAQRIKNNPMPPRIAAALVEKLANAISYANGQGVIHRDLKPANILLSKSNEPEPMIADFGLAKDLTKTDLTDSDAILGTIAYMAPEQTQSPTPRAAPTIDIYGLGTILYDSLTGKPLFSSDNNIDLLEKVREQQPHWPKAVLGRHSLDVVTICNKALAKEPAKRYATAKDLADDLRRYLDRKPILARRTGRIERAVKWSKRHPAVAALYVVVAFSIFGLASALYVINEERKDAINARNQADIAKNQADNAKNQAVVAQESEHQRLLQVRKLAREVIFDLLPVLERLPGATHIRKSLATATVDRLEELQKLAIDDPSLLHDLVRAYHRLGDVQGHPAKSNYGDSNAALNSYRMALSIIDESLIPSDLANFDYKADRARIFEKTGDVLKVQGKLPESLASYESARQIWLKLVADRPENDAYHISLAGNWGRVGDWNMRNQQIDEALKNFLESSNITAKLVERNRTSENLANLALTQDKLGVAYRDRKQNDLALSRFREALTIRLDLVKGRPDDADYQDSLAISWQHVGTIQVVLEQTTDALDSYRNCLEIYRRLSHADANDVRSRRNLGTVGSLIGDLLFNANERQQAWESYLEASDHALWLHERDKANAQFLDDLAISYFKLASVRTAFGEDEKLSKNDRLVHWREASNLAKEALTIFQALKGAGKLAATSVAAPKMLTDMLVDCNKHIKQLEKN